MGVQASAYDPISDLPISTAMIGTTRRLFSPTPARLSPGTSPVGFVFVRHRFGVAGRSLAGGRRSGWSSPNRALARLEADPLAPFQYLVAFELPIPLGVVGQACRTGLVDP